MIGRSALVALVTSTAATFSLVVAIGTSLTDLRTVPPAHVPSARPAQLGDLRSLVWEGAHAPVVTAGDGSNFAVDARLYYVTSSIEASIATINGALLDGIVPG